MAGQTTKEEEKEPKPEGASSGKATEVLLHVYDVTNSGNPKTNQAIMQINRVMRDNLGIGGIFHGAVEVYGEEWSFGFCETGSGVFSCPPKENPMYNYRESIVLGSTELSQTEVRRVLRKLSRDWPGVSYDLLGRNCNHFCDDFCQRLGQSAGRMPLWVNRFANAGDVAVEVAGATVDQFQRLQSNLSLGAKVAYKYIFGGSDGEESKEELSEDEGSKSTSNSPKEATRSSKKENEKSGQRTMEARDSTTASSSDKEGQSSKTSSSNAESSSGPSEESGMDRSMNVKNKASGGLPREQEKLGSPDRTGSPQSVLGNAEEGGSWRHYFPLLRAVATTTSSTTPPVNN